MDIILSNSSGKPIYEQITDQVKEQIILVECQCGIFPLTGVLIGCLDVFISVPLANVSSSNSCSYFLFLSPLALSPVSLS